MTPLGSTTVPDRINTSGGAPNDYNVVATATHTLNRPDRH